MGQGTRQLAAAVVVALLASAAGVALDHIPLLVPFGLKTLDLQFRLLASHERVDDRIVIVEVDQPSIDRFDQDNISFPWPRSLYGPIVEYAAGAGAKAVMFDILYNNLSNYGPGEDDAFAGAIGEAGNVYLAAAFFRSDQGRDKQVEARFGKTYEGEAPAAVDKASASLPLPAIRAAVAGLGGVTHRPDVDGIYRRVNPLIRFDGRVFGSLSVAPLLRGAGGVSWGDGQVRINGLSIPVNAAGEYWINYKGPQGSYRHYPAAAVIESAVLARQGKTPPIPASAFADSHVFVAYTAPGLFDLKPTPVSAVSPGVEVHAVVLDNLLNGDFLQAAPRTAVLSFAAAGALVMAVSVLLAPALWQTAVTGVSVFALLLAGALASFAQGYWMNILALETPAMLALLGAAMYRYQVEGKKRRFIHNAFSHYLAPKVVQQLVENPERLELGGERKELTVFFSDLVGFTSLSERLQPQELVEVLNGYTSFMSDTIAAAEGTVDKYIGDAVMAFWGAPVEQDDQSERALLAALESRERLAEFGEHLAREHGDISINMRIGIDRGDCVVGNMGSVKRFNYTVIGDTVNQAARLEGLNKAYGTRILAGEHAWEAGREAVFGRLVDFLRVKGKDVPVRVYEVMARRGRETPQQQWLQARYEAAFEAYQRRDWCGAARMLEQILERERDGPSGTLLDRVNQYETSPPDPDWDGAYTHTSK